MSWEDDAIGGPPSDLERDVARAWHEASGIMSHLPEDRYDAVVAGTANQLHAMGDAGSYFDDMRDGLYGRTGQRLAAELEREYPELRGRGVDEGRRRWILTSRTAREQRLWSREHRAGRALISVSPPLGPACAWPRDDAAPRFMVTDFPEYRQQCAATNTR